MKKEFTFDRDITVVTNNGKIVNFLTGSIIPNIFNVSKLISYGNDKDIRALMMNFMTNESCLSQSYVLDKDSRLRFSTNALIKVFENAQENKLIKSVEVGEVKDKTVFKGSIEEETMDIYESDIKKPIRQAIDIYTQYCIKNYNIKDKENGKTYDRYFIVNPGNTVIEHVKKSLGEIVIPCPSEEIEKCFKFELERYNTKLDIYRLILKVKIPNGNNRIDKVICHLGNLTFKDKKAINSCVDNTYECVVMWIKFLKSFFDEHKSQTKDSVKYSEGVKKFKEEHKDWNSVPSNNDYWGTLNGKSYTVFGTGPININECPEDLSDGVETAVEVNASTVAFENTDLTVTDTPTKTKKSKTSKKTTPKSETRCEVPREVVTPQEDASEPIQSGGELVGVKGISYGKLTSIVTLANNLKITRIDSGKNEDKKFLLSVSENNFKRFIKLVSYISGVTYDVI